MATKIDKTKVLKDSDIDSLMDVFIVISEQWKRFRDTTYLVSSHGRVSNNDFISQHKHNRGYSCVGLYIDNKFRTMLVHRLVAETFLPNPENLPCVNHRNEVRTDNRIENLEWCTNKYNHNYGSINERISLSNSKRPIGQFAFNGKLVKEIEKSSRF